MKKIIPLLILIVSSCTTTKDNNAVSRVISKPQLTERVGRMWEKQNPCTVDTTVIFQHGTETTRYDTVGIPIESTVYDTLTNVKTVTVYKNIIKTVKIHDTLLRVEVDTRRLNLALSDNENLKGQMSQLNIQYEETRHRSNKKDWYIGILILFLLCGTYLKIKHII